MESVKLENINISINEVLKKLCYENITVKFPDYDPCGGYASEVCFAQVKGEKQGKEETLDLFIKSNRVDKNGSILFDDHLYLNEINFYEILEPALRDFCSRRNVAGCTNIPNIYGTDSRNGLHVIIMKNLKLEGFRCNEMIKTLDSKHIRLILKSYAIWAAINLAMADQEPETFQKAKMNSSFSDEFLKVYIATFSKGINEFIDICRDKNRTEMVTTLENFAGKVGDEFRQLFTLKDGPYQILRHGDCWNNNYLFRYNDETHEPEETVIIDWQLAILGSPLADVCSLLFFCCSKVDLEQLDEFLKYYYDILSSKLTELGSNPSKVFPWDVCVSAFKKHTLIGLAGTASAMKMRYLQNVPKDLNLEKIKEEGDFCSILGGTLRDPEEYFQEVYGIFELCSKRGFI